MTTMPIMTNKNFFYLILLLSSILVGTLFFVSPVHQDLAYHHFAEQRFLFNIPHWGDFLTNIAFAITGLLLLRFKNNLEVYAGQKKLFYCFVLSCFALCLGSGYYHYNPDNESLVWDRATMLLGFALILIDTAIRYHIFNEKHLLTKIFFIEVLFLITLLPWIYFDRLELYVLAQFFVMSVMPLLALKNYLETKNMGYAVSTNNHNLYQHILYMFLFYSLAKFFEHYDLLFYQLLNFSGHSIKHICYAIALYMFGRNIFKKAS